MLTGQFEAHSPKHFVGSHLSRSILTMPSLRCMTIGGSGGGRPGGGGGFRMSSRMRFSSAVMVVFDVVISFFSFLALYYYFFLLEKKYMNLGFFKEEGKYIHIYTRAIK